MRNLVPLLRQPGVEYAPMTGDALIERARSVSATWFLENSTADIHLSIDSDITGFTVEDTMAMCELAMEHGIVGASYVCRSAARTFPASYYADGVRVEHAFEHKAVPIKWAATGFLAVHRRVFESLKEDLPLLHPADERHFYPFYQTMIYDRDDIDNGPILLSEDYAFCERARQKGFGVYLDPAVRLGHIGSYIYRLEDIAQAQVDPQPLAVTREGRRWRVESIEREPVHA